MSMIGGLPPQWAHAAEWARAVAALSGAVVALWALVRWPLGVLLRAAVLAALRATRGDEELRRALREHARGDAKRRTRP